MKYDQEKTKKQIGFLGMLLVLFVCNLVLSHSILNVNIELLKTSEERHGLNAEITELKVTAAKLSSSEYILAQAKKQGFQKAQKVIYLFDNEMLAKND